MKANSTKKVTAFINAALILSNIWICPLNTALASESKNNDIALTQQNQSTDTSQAPLPVTDVPQTLTAGEIHPIAIDKGTQEDKDSDFFPYEKTFIISAYYSPIKGQKKYVTGSYYGDIRLNGGGVRGADGTPVYPGMIAAPKGYSFGTKMQIPSLGTVAVHDRGGAIVLAGVRSNAHDRLDVWMGYGDSGLTRALKWGKRTLSVKILGTSSKIAENVFLEGFSQSEKNIVANTLTPEIKSPNDLSPKATPSIAFKASTLNPGTKGEDVKKVQEILKNLNYYQGNISSIFDNPTRKAVAKFQVTEKIVASETSFGAGYIGPKTLKMLASKAEVTLDRMKEVTINSFTKDLVSGDTGDDVRKLQVELRRLNLLGVAPTGFYGDVTSHAVFKFQQKYALAGDKVSIGAGVFGPKTRATLNEIIDRRERTINLMAKNIKPKNKNS